MTTAARLSLQPSPLALLPLSSSSSSAPPSSFFSSVLSSVAAAVSTVTLPSGSPLPSSSFSHTSSFPSPSAFSGEAAAATSDGQLSAAPDSFTAFHELDIAGRQFRHSEAVLQQLPAEPSVPASFPSSASESAASAPLHPFLLAHQRMSLLSSVLSDEVGGFLSPRVFFPRSCLFLPSLRLPAVQQQLAAMEEIESHLDDVRRVAEMAAQRHAEAAAAPPGQTVAADGEQPAGQEGLRPVLDALSIAVTACHRLQNELAFSLMAIKETTAASASSSAASTQPLADVGESHDAAQPASIATEASADSTVAAEPVAAAVSLSAVGAVGLSSVDRLSSRVKALGYSLAKSAHRMSKQVMQDRLSTEQALAFIAHTQRIHAQLTALLPVYNEAADRARAGAAGAGEGVERELLSRFSALGLFVCEVLVVLLVDDAQRALLRYLAEQQEQLTHNGLQSEQRRQQQQQQQEHSEQAGQTAQAAGLEVESAEQLRAEETPQSKAEAATAHEETAVIADHNAAGIDR